MRKKPDWIFECQKCEHVLYVDKRDIKKLKNTDCPNCGEESHRNWLFIDEGDWDVEKNEYVPPSDIS